MNPDTGIQCSYYCTGCSSRIKSASRAFLHPLLECLICFECYSAYGNGDFEKIKNGVDEQGFDNLCRWCSDGGTLLMCDNNNGRHRCHYAFCLDCIRRNCPGDAISATQTLSIRANWKWICFICAPQKLARVKVGSRKALTNLNRRISASNDHSRKSGGHNRAAGRA